MLKRDKGDKLDGLEIVDRCLLAFVVFVILVLGLKILLP